MNLEQVLQARLQERRDQSLYRQRITTAGPQQTVLRSQGQDYLCFTSNDYLGLANHPQLIAAMQSAAQDLWRRQRCLPFGVWT